MKLLQDKWGELVQSFFERLKDFIYESMDYILILAIIVAVVSLIGWRLDILFNDDAVAKSPPVVSDETNGWTDEEDDDIGESNPDPTTNEDEEPTGEETDVADNPDVNTPDDTSDNTPDDTPDTITINIPDGTLPSGIGSILESNGLIESKNEFVLRAQSLGLDRKLKAGTFRIKTNSSLDEIIKILAQGN